jgi:predicted Zn-dependent protease
MKYLQYTALALALLALVGLHTACSTNPATGQRQLNVLSESEEIRIGEKAEPEFLGEYGGPIPSPTIRQYVSRIGQDLAAQSERPDLPWEFHVVDSSAVNAFALPGGKIFITRGLLSKFQNEAQVAGVLGHEIGHVTAQHIGQQMSRGLILQGIGIGIGVAGSQSDQDWLTALGIGTSVGGTLYLLKFSRDQETQSDELGLRYMTQLGYNPVGQLQVMKILKREAGQRGGGGLEILSTHPMPDTRIDRLEKVIKKEYPDHDDPSAYHFDQDRFNKRVLEELKDLPPPKHPKDQKDQQSSAAPLQPLAHATAESAQ